MTGPAASAFWARLLVALLGLVLWAGPGHAASGPSVRVDVQARQPVLVGQQVPIEVTVAAPNFFLSAPPFPTLDLQGAVVTMPDERGIHGVEQEGGQTVATIQKTYVFTAQQPGDFQLPPVKIDFTYQGDDGKTQQASLTLPSTHITVQLPAGAAAQATGGAAMPAALLVIQQELDRDASGLLAGDALVRTVRIQAAQAPAMLIPPPHFEAPSDVRMFKADPVLRDSNGQGGSFAGGERIERVTYVFEHSGRYTLPAVELQWLDPQTQKPVKAQAPAVTVQVKAGAHAGERIAPELPVGAATAPARKPIDWLSVAMGLLALLVVAVLALWLRARWPDWQRRRAQKQAAHAQSDEAMFDRALAACRAGDAQAAHSSLLAWSQAHARGTPGAWARSLDDEVLVAQLELLARQLYRSGGPDAGSWSGSACATALREAHRAWRLRFGASVQRHPPGRHLGPLNPFKRGA